ncbi:MAG: HD domain-containing protein [Gemmatimonadales bacterium]|nr:HD domain-containing protein [Gemmatimonadales bacterium]
MGIKHLFKLSLPHPQGHAQHHRQPRPAGAAAAPDPASDPGRYLCAMAEPPVLPTAAPGDRIQSPLVILDVHARGTGDTAHTILTFGNASGRLESAPFWPGEQHLVAAVRKGQVAQVIGEVQLYRDRRQLKVTSLRVLPRQSVDVRQLLPAIPDPAPYWEVLDRWRAEIRGPRLRAVLALLFDDPEFRDRFAQSPASLAGHHALLGGLLKHTAEVAAIARAVSRASGADGDLVLAGVLLHDIGKLEAYRWDTHFEMTEAGALMGHVVLGAQMLDRAVLDAATPPCTDEELLLLQHLILSHHGRHEYGAPVLPMTLEAEVLHYADNASAKSASMAEAIGNPENFTEDEQVSNRRIWSLENRKIYRGRSDWGG